MMRWNIFPAFSGLPQPWFLSIAVDFTQNNKRQCLGAYFIKHYLKKVKGIGNLILYELQYIPCFNALNTVNYTYIP